MTPKQQQEFSQRLQAALENVIISNSNVLKQWHVFAMKSLEFVSPDSLKIAPEYFEELIETTPQGINANIVSCLCNAIVQVNASQFKVSLHDYFNILKLNTTVANTWTALVNPIKDQIYSDIINRAKIHTIN